ncbi:hypothetical protein ACIA8O_17820 [Kitasatospora sp. NPDC051853]|uniref:hypothetical protein n=1 Tax=Kitasatospora sp. NPDC051853 TaxID=3364058 RepID=UPI0037ABF2BA
MRTRPPEVLYALAENPALPEWAVRRLLRSRDEDTARHLAKNPNLPTVVRHRLAGHRSAFVRTGLLRSEDGRTPELYARFVTDPAPEVRADLAASSGAPPEVRARLATDPDATVRTALAQWWVEAPEAVRRTLLTDPDGAVRAAACAVYYPRLPHPVPPADLHRALLDDPLTRAGVVPHLDLTPELATALAEDPDERVREKLAARADLPEAVLARLAEDPSPLVRLAVLLRRDSPEDLRASIHAWLEAGARALADENLTDEQAELAVYHELALADLNLHLLPWLLEEPQLGLDSPYVCFRHSAALSDHLTPDQRARLLDDPVPHVRLAAASYGIDPGTAERLERRHPARGKFRGRPADHADFPVGTLRRFATDEDPWIRRRAARDPDLPVELLTALARDEDRNVRLVAAGHPGLPVDVLVELLDHPDRSTAAAAARAPRLPAAAVGRLLADAGL